MLLTRYEPNNLFDLFNNEVNRLFTHTRHATPAQASEWMPAVDIREDEDRYVLCADLPGIDRKDVEITVEDGVLTLRGVRTTVSDETRDSYRRRERSQGTFLRQFTLPETAATETISASASNGVLEIVIPKQAKPQPQKITVN